MNFTRTIHCKSRRHCRACRHDAAFRASLVQTFGPFECPLEIPPGEKRNLPVPANKTGGIEASAANCRFAEVLDEPFPPARPCKGRMAICRNPACPAEYWYEAGCNPEKCRFHT